MSQLPHQPPSLSLPEVPEDKSSTLAALAPSAPYEHHPLLPCPHARITVRRKTSQLELWRDRVHHGRPRKDSRERHKPVHRDSGGQYPKQLTVMSRSEREADPLAFSRGKLSIVSEGRRGAILVVEGDSAVVNIPLVHGTRIARKQTGKERTDEGLVAPDKTTDGEEGEHNREYVLVTAHQPLRKRQAPQHSPLQAIEAPSDSSCMGVRPPHGGMELLVCVELLEVHYDSRRKCRCFFRELEFVFSQYCAFGVGAIESVGSPLTDEGRALDVAAQTATNTQSRHAYELRMKGGAAERIQAFGSGCGLMITRGSDALGAGIRTFAHAYTHNVTHWFGKKDREVTQQAKERAERHNKIANDVYRGLQFVTSAIMTPVRLLGRGAASMSHTITDMMSPNSDNNDGGTTTATPKRDRSLPPPPHHSRLHTGTPHSNTPDASTTSRRTVSVSAEPQPSQPSQPSSSSSPLARQFVQPSVRLPLNPPQSVGDTEGEGEDEESAGGRGGGVRPDVHWRRHLAEVVSSVGIAYVHVMRNVDMGVKNVVESIQDAALHHSKEVYGEDWTNEVTKRHVEALDRWGMGVYHGLYAYQMGLTDVAMYMAAEVGDQGINRIGYLSGPVLMQGYLLLASPPLRPDFQKRWVVVRPWSICFYESSSHLARRPLYTIPTGNLSRRCHYHRDKEEIETSTLDLCVFYMRSTFLAPTVPDLADEDVGGLPGLPPLPAGSRRGSVLSRNSSMPIHRRSTDAAESVIVADLAGESQPASAASDLSPTAHDRTRSLSPSPSPAPSGRRFPRSSSDDTTPFHSLEDMPGRGSLDDHSPTMSDRGVDTSSRGSRRVSLSSRWHHRHGGGGLERRFRGAFRRWGSLGADVVPPGALEEARRELAMWFDKLSNACGRTEDICFEDYGSALINELDVLEFEKPRRLRVEVTVLAGEGLGLPPVPRSLIPLPLLHRHGDKGFLRFTRLINPYCVAVPALSSGHEITKEERQLTSPVNGTRDPRWEPPTPVTFGDRVSIDTARVLIVKVKSKELKWGDDEIVGSIPILLDGFKMALDHNLGIKPSPSSLSDVMPPLRAPSTDSSPPPSPAPSVPSLFPPSPGSSSSSPAAAAWSGDTDECFEAWMALQPASAEHLATLTENWQLLQKVSAAESSPGRTGPLANVVAAFGQTSHGMWRHIKQTFSRGSQPCVTDEQRGAEDGQGESEEGAVPPPVVSASAPTLPTKGEDTHETNEGAIGNGDGTDGAGGGEDGEGGDEQSELPEGVIGHLHIRIRAYYARDD
ncbi:unnamed protein product [Vitrella brassicaformis CCMP3155]|uniref:C2 domain-containing protein n=2 Tax=Vitrella brassicaformis TaxID=1169539 RepID=A0A0G4EAX9_VITBC|nr:unnamed protein product [Vitrella brassicaformis CCMP3155]|eukprot:CEL92444.1 unnamed protein product [Vitrella brassicaformis CCMP3155]